MSKAEPSLDHLTAHLECWPKIEQHLADGLTLHRYQIDSVLTVVNRLEGRAILADEVGLGKTIEAGLVAQELRAKGLVNQVLILVPAGLVSQWIHELRNKFGWRTCDSARDKGWLWVFSIDKAKKSPLYQQLQYVNWDLVIVDEAHHLKHTDTLNYRRDPVIPHAPIARILQRLHDHVINQAGAPETCRQRQNDRGVGYGVHGSQSVSID